MKKADKEDAAYFSLGNMAQLAELDEHIQYAEELLGRYQWKSTTKRKLNEQIRQIREKQKDEKLNISVIGEFNSGKSTLINALLRAKVLEENIRPGMTAACTILTYGPKYSISLRRHGGKEKTYRYGSLEELREQVKYYTTEESVASEIEQVKIQLPSQNLNGDFRIIDTPGTNHTTAWHEEVTKRTIQEVSDLSIIVVNASKPLPDTLCTFVQENLDYILNQCIFVVTMLDQVRARERERLLQYVRTKAKQEFGISEPVVLPYVSPAVLAQYCQEESGEPEPDDSGADGRTWEGIRYGGQEFAEFLALSMESEKKLLEHTARQRSTAQTKKLLWLVDVMYDSITEQMNHMSEDYDRKLALLLRTKQTDLGQFIAEQKLEHEKEYARVAKELMVDCRNELQQAELDATSAVLGKIAVCNNVGQIKNYSDTRLQSDCAEQGRAIAARTEEMYGKFKEVFEEQMRLFCKRFKKEFKNLDILDVDLDGEDFQFAGVAEVKVTDLNSAAGIIATNLKKEDTVFYGGAAAGAVVGTMVFPVVGTLIGGVLGAVGGMFFAPPIGEVKRKVNEKLSPGLNSYYRGVEHECENALQRYSDQLYANIGGEIDRYLAEYRSLVDAKIQAQQLQKEKIEEKKSEITQDIDRIKLHKFRMESIQEKLNKMGMEQ